MNGTQVSILIYGRNANLLETSQWALQSRGYRVIAATNLAEFDSIPQRPPVDLLVLSHKLSLKECAAASSHAAARWPGIKKLALTQDNSSSSGKVLGQVRQALDITEGLLSRVSELVGYAASTSYSHIY